MSQRSHTQDERLILAAYQMVKEANDDDLIMDRYVVGTSIGLAKKATDTICRTLMQTNFFKKVDDVNFRLTKNGVSLAERLLDE